MRRISFRVSIEFEKYVHGFYHFDLSPRRRVSIVDSIDRLGPPLSSIRELISGPRFDWASGRLFRKVVPPMTQFHLHHWRMERSIHFWKGGGRGWGEIYLFFCFPLFWILIWNLIVEILFTVFIERFKLCTMWRNVCHVYMRCMHLLCMISFVKILNFA